MKQVMHILKKDIQCFRIEILLVLVSAWISVRSSGALVDGVFQPAVFQIPIWLAGTFLITRVIHAEAIPGTRLYWLTRPYSWKSLIAEKLLFLFLFVGLPPAIAMLVSVAGAGFSIPAFLPSLALWEVELFLAWVVPIAALAALTEGLAAFLAALLFTTAISTTVGGFAADRALHDFPNPAFWLHGFFGGVVAAVGGSVILYLQYRTRWTPRSRAYAVGVLVLGIIVLNVTPFALAMNVQSALSRRKVDHSSMSVSLNNEMFDKADETGVTLDLKGTPAGIVARADSLVGEVVDANGGLVDFSMRELVLTEKSAQGAPRLLVFIGKPVLDRLRGKPVTVRGSVWVTLSTADKTFDLTPGDADVQVADGAFCGMRGGFYRCRAMLGSPRGLLQVHPLGRSNPFILGSGSYSPFPSLDMSPYDELILEGEHDRPRTVQITYSEPVSHFRLPFDIRVERFLQ